LDFRISCFEICLGFSASNLGLEDYLLPPSPKLNNIPFTKSFSKVLNFEKADQKPSRSFYTTNKYLENLPGDYLNHNPKITCGIKFFTSLPLKTTGLKPIASSQR